MSDQILRREVHARLLKDFNSNPSCLVLDELGVDYGRSRIDIAIINGSIIGYELKSTKDNLNRLARQVDSYNLVFDRLFLVASDNHIQHAEALVPAWWGIIVASEYSNNSFEFSSLRSPQQNPSVDKYSLSKLLWRPELIDALTQRGLVTLGTRKNKRQLSKILCDEFSIEGVKDLVIASIKARSCWRDY